MHVLATAGHVDHGKSALVLALTGIDPDRLEEEKRRGLTIDLGFAWMALASGREVGIIDVPGHERFIRNMLAGVGAVNATLFVVAANEGWMPQSQEHLDILDLLGVDNAVVAVTKSDTVEDARLPTVLEDASERISGTSLQGSTVVAVSAPTGRGVEELRHEIEMILDLAPPAENHQRPRLWIDRVFSMKGAGTVVTGTLIDGDLTVGDEVAILPGGFRSRIRSIQTHNREVERIGPGNRTALNLVGIEKATISRGEVAVSPGDWATTRVMAVRLRFLSHLDYAPSERGAFKFHLGSFESDVRVRFLEAVDRNEVLAALDLSGETVADFGDRFVLRDSGRRRTVGGGVVLEPHPRQLRRADPALLERLRTIVGGDRTAYLAGLLDERGWLSEDEVRVWVGPSVSPEDVEAVRLRGSLMSPSTFRQLSDRIGSTLRRHHKAEPLEPGVDRAQLRAEMELPGQRFDELIEELANRGDVVTDGEFLRRPDHEPRSGEERGSLIDKLTAAAPSPPTREELRKEFDDALIRSLIRSGELIQVSPDLVYPPEAMSKIEEALASEIGQRGPVTVARFRDLIGTTRKYAVPLLEYLDSTGFTRRDGDRRVLGPRATAPRSS